MALLRWLVLAGFAFWMGGFVFYAGVVLPVLRDELDTTGNITRQVSVALNISGVVALAVWWTEAALTIRQRSWRRAYLTTLVIPSVALAALAWMHPYVAALAAPEASPKAFYTWHRVYLWIATIQFFVASAALFLAVLRWRAWDRVKSGAVLDG